MLYNKTPRSKQNVFLHQSKSPTITNSPYKKSKESTDVRQDKGALTKALSASRQPGSVDKGSRAGAFLDNYTARTQNSTRRVKLVHTTIWLHPLVHAELKRIAERELLSLSQVGAIACEEWVRYDIHRQQASLLRTELRQIIREELAAFGNRIVFFLMKIAFPAEQARILTTNVLKWVCKLAGLDLKAYYTMVDDASKMAKRNIIAKSPQIKDLMDKWDGMFADDKKEEKTQGKEERTN
jgi:hypothetical protein